MSGQPFPMPEVLRAEQGRRLREMLAVCRTAHPAYRGRWQGIDLERIAGVEDIALLPLTTKEQYMADPESYRLEGDETIWDVMYTTGTTSRPTPFHSTARDYYNILEVQRRMAAIRGMTGSDVIANLYPLTPRPHGAFIRCNQAAMVLGARLVVGGGGVSYGDYDVHRPLDDVIRVVADAGPTVLWGVPSYIRRLLLRAAELGAGLPAVRMLAVSGEAVSEEMRDELRRRLQAVGSEGAVISNSLGATEMQGGMVECVEGAGFHNPAPELFLLEAVDEAGRPVPDGEEGLLALTHLRRSGTVLVRYLLGDLVRLTHEPCPHCGHVGGRVVSNPLRTGNLVKVRGTLINLDAIKGLVLGWPGVVEYQVELASEDPGDPFSMDVLNLRVALEWETDLGALGDAVKRVTGVRPRVLPVPLQELYDPNRDFKPRRFVSRRAAGGV